MKPSDSKHRPASVRVGLVLQTGQALMRGISRGVYQFLRVNRHWRIHGEGQYPLLQWDQVANWEGDGLIAVINSEEQLETLLDAGVPVINAGSRIVDPRITTVACNSRAIGTIAAEHLLACGLKNFLYMSELKWENERLRHDAFVETVKAAEQRCETLRLPVHEYIAGDASGHYRPDLGAIADALKQIEKPVGVCTPNSVLARVVAEVAHECDFDVPDQIAVIGVNDDPLICESTVPHLSAVVQPSEQIGYEAAKRLDLLMAGKPVEENAKFFMPVGVEARQSTDMLAVDDEDVRMALRYVREHAHEPIDVADVATRVAVSRRTLETKFREAIGRTPALELRRVRIELAKKLLAETNDPITSVVFASGFNSRQVFSTLFRKATGHTPSEYRRRFQIEVLAPR